MMVSFIVFKIKLSNGSLAFILPKVIFSIFGHKCSMYSSPWYGKSGNIRCSDKRFLAIG